MGGSYKFKTNLDVILGYLKHVLEKKQTILSRVQMPSIKYIVESGLYHFEHSIPTLTRVRNRYNPDSTVLYHVSMAMDASFEPRHEIFNNVVCATSKASDQPAHTRSLIRAFASRLNILSY